MEDLDYRALASQFGSDLITESSKFDRKNLKRSNPANLIFSCSCKICENEAKDKYKKLGVSVNSNIKEKTAENGYTWLLEKIGMISLEFSVKLNIPDVAVFKKGKAAFFLQFQRDRTLKMVTAAERITNQEIIKTLTSIVRIRKKEDINYKNGKIRSSSTVEYGKETACLRFMSRGRDNDLEDVLSEDENGALKIMNESEFTGLMWQRSGSTIWKTVCYIQSALKTRTGIGESFIHSYSFSNFQTSELVESGNNDNEETEDLLYKKGQSLYCEYIFKKLYYLFEKHLNILILHIKGEFVRDDNNRIWLVHASNIIAKDAPTRIVKQKETEVTVIRHHYNDSLLNHLVSIAKQPKNARTERFSNLMNNECQKILDKTNIMDIMKPPEPDVLNSSAFAKLRVLTPYRLEDLLDSNNARQIFEKYSEDKKKRKSKSKIDKEICLYQTAKLVENTPKKNLNSWTFTPKIKRPKTRPQSSKPSKSFYNSILL